MPRYKVIVEATVTYTYEIDAADAETALAACRGEDPIDTERFLGEARAIPLDVVSEVVRVS